MRIACSFEPAILIYFYRGVISQPLFSRMQFYYQPAITSISTKAFFGRFATSTQTRAGQSVAKYVA